METTKTAKYLGNKDLKILRQNEETQNQNYLKQFLSDENLTPKAVVVKGLKILGQNEELKYKNLVCTIKGFIDFKL